MVGTFGLIRFSLAAAVALFHAGLLTSVVGMTSVLLFYFLSGIVIQLAIQGYKGKFWWPSFILNRFLRLAPSFLMVSILTLFIFNLFSENLKLAYTFSDLRPLIAYTNSHLGLEEFTHLIKISLSLEKQTLSGMTPVIPQGWSIIIEFLFYLTLVHKNVRFYYVATPVFLLISILIFLDAFQQEVILLWYANYVATAVFFLLGSLMTILSKEFKIKSSVTLIYTFTGLFFVIFFSAPIGNSTGNREILVQTAVFTTLGIVLFSLIYIVASDIKESEFSKFVGKLSYPIYVGHIFCIGVLNAFGVAILTKNDLINLGEIDSRRLLAANFPMLSLFLTLILAIILTFTIEIPMEKVRKVIKSNTRRCI